MDMGRDLGLNTPQPSPVYGIYIVLSSFSSGKKNRILSNFSKLQSYTLTLDIAVMNLMKCNVTMAIRIIRFTLHFYETLELVHAWIRLL